MNKFKIFIILFTLITLPVDALILAFHPVDDSLPFKASQPAASSRSSSLSVSDSPRLPVPILPSSNSSVSAPPTEVKPAKTKNQHEPYRVFLPTGADGKIVDNIVWLPEEFFRLLHKLTPDTQQLKSNNWNIESAEYTGKLTGVSIDQSLEVAELKAVYQIGIESENVTITLPALPLATTDATWDSIPIRAAWQIGKVNSNTEKNDNRILTFKIENAKPGIHKLEIPLKPPITQSIDNFRISFDIPKTPNAKLKLIIPHVAPPISIAESLGSITCSTIQNANNPNAPETATNNNNQNQKQLVAEIGQVTKLALSWNNDLFRNELSGVKAESFIQMQTRISQVDIRTKFNYKVTGNKIRYVNILLDDHWQISGQFLCDEHQIDRVETINESIESPDGGIARREIARVIFKSPVAGSFTLRAGFVLRDFSGIGHVRLPDIKPYRITITKTALAILSDPLLELDLPERGRNKSISPDWNTNFPATPTATPTAAVTGNLTAAAATTLDQKTFSNVQFLAEYNINQTQPDWRLAIKTKSITPKITLVQSALLDAGDSTIQYAAEFETAAEMFKQNFTLPQSVAVESIEVVDSQRNAIPIRWGRTQNAKIQNNETRIERTIFFRKPLANKYRINIIGHFATNNINRAPLIEFDNVELSKNQFELYRTTAIIVHGNTNETIWKPENIQRNLFANAKFIRSWNASNTTNTTNNLISPQLIISHNRPIIQGEIITTLFPLPNPQPASHTTSTSREQPTNTTNISATINPADTTTTTSPTPTISSTTSSTTTSTINSENNWSAIFDINWQIPAGELEQIKFQLDENINYITSIEPPVTWSIEQQPNGRSQLVITPAEIAKTQRLKIHTTINEQNRTISLPKIVPQWHNGEQAEIKNYVILPNEIQTDIANRIIESEIAKDGGDAKLQQISWNLSNLQKVDETLRKKLIQATQQNPTALYLAATTNDYSASITQNGDKPSVTFYDVNFFINDNGNLFGTATLDLKNTSDDKFIIAMPESYELIKITVSGGATGGGSVSGGGVKIDRNRWQLEICGSDYPLRIGLIFHAVFDSAPMILPLPVLENVEVNETLWTISYDKDSEISRRYFNVSVTKTAETTETTETKLSGNSGGGGGIIVTEMLGRQIPATGETAAAMLFKFDMARLDNLLFIAAGLPTPAAGKNVEIKRWFTQWEQEWTGINRTINYLKTTYPSILNNAENKILLTPTQEKNSGQRSINSIISLMDSPEKSLQALQIRRDRELHRLGIIVTENLVLPSLIESNPVVLCRISMTKAGANLFGTVKGGISEIRLTPVTETSKFAGNFNFILRAIIIAGIFAAAIIILRRYRKISLKETFLRYPIFWFIGFGCSMIIFFPDGIISVAIIVTTLLASLKKKNINLTGISTTQENKKQPSNK
ncbi:MAG: hypothetical protein LBP59_16940 [Planctomycetaceae bacterium]|jgi:hypothetical protein|nr:hypothetical protein [Planctomycetaceae bacterium]